MKKKITPIFELVPQDFSQGSTDSILKNHARQIATSWGWNDLFFIEFQLLGENRAPHCLPLFVNQAKPYNLKAGLVTGLSRSDAYQLAIKAALKKTELELCFRISAYDLRQAGFQQALKNLLDFFGNKASGVHLAIDFQTICEPLPEIAAFSNVIPSINAWRSITIIAGAFPKDLSHLKKNGQCQSLFARRCNRGCKPSKQNQSHFHPRQNNTGKDKTRRACFCGSRIISREVTAVTYS